MDFIIHNLEQRSREWFEFRKGKIGASQAATIMGLNPWQTRLQLWEELILDKSKESNAAMERGTRLEPLALEWANERLKDTFVPIVAQCKEHPEIIASLDGWNGDYLIEIKCPGKGAHDLALEGTIPSYYYPQLQHQMFVTNTPSCGYISFDGQSGVIIPCSRNWDFISKMVKEELAFAASLIDFKPPEASDMDMVQIDDPEASCKAERYKHLDLLIQELESEKEAIKRELIQDAIHPRLAIGNLKMTKIIRMGNVDYTSIPMLKGLDLSEYRKKPTEIWRVTYD